MSNTLSVHFDGNTYNHTEESLIGLIKSEDYNKKLSEEWKDKFTIQRSNVYDIREKVHAFFKSYHLVGDTEITMELDEINGVELREIRCEINISEIPNSRAMAQGFCA